MGLAVAGFIGVDRRQVRFSPHLPWRDTAVAERAERRVGVPVLLEHDANAAAVAEYRFGASGGAEVAVLVMLAPGSAGRCSCAVSSTEAPDGSGGPERRSGRAAGDG